MERLGFFCIMGKVRFEFKGGRLVRVECFVKVELVGLIGMLVFFK